ncbi:MAG TPA: T9SS type A sorting domain-containing protein [Flavobacterium lutivivi]|nr:T9SS type A sorting domain-containing protein [Flavobacterium lutivivi]
MYKKSNYFLILLFLFGSLLFAQKKNNKNIQGEMIIGPTGVSTLAATSNLALICTVNGVQITTSGNSGSGYATNGTPFATCTPSAYFSGFGGNWTSWSSTGTITYTFNQPIISATVSYHAVNSEDIGTISIDATGMQLSNLCGLSSNGSVLTCTYPTGTWGDVALTVSSNNPFTSITLMNTGGASGWVTGNPCNFSLTPAVISNCSKVYLNDLCYNATQSQTTSYTLFNNANNGVVNSTCDFAIIGNTPCNSSNVTIELITQLTNGCILNPNGTITIPAGTMPFNSEAYYRFRSIQFPSFVSQPFRVNYGIADKVYPAYPIVYLHTGSAPYQVYSNGSVNILNTPIISKINPNSNGNCNLINAIINQSNVSNTVTVTETTTPQNPYYKIDLQTGSILFRAPYSSSNPPPAPTLPSQSYTLTYSMCINNTGASNFCKDASVVINYYYGSNREMKDVVQENDVAIYPNPSDNGIFNLLFDKEIKEGTIEVYNLLGQKVKQETIQNATVYQLNLGEIITGNYIIKLNDGSQQMTKRIVIK